MTISRDMLTAAQQAKTLLGDSAETVGAYLRGQILPGGGFADRHGTADLYYTAFGLQALTALGSAMPVEPLAEYLDAFGDGDGLDLVHWACLVRCRALLGLAEAANRRPKALRRLEGFRSADGGYAHQAGAEVGSAYGCFFALGAAGDLSAEPPDAVGLARCLQALRTPDGSYANDRRLPIGATPSTAAAVTALGALGWAAPADVAAWLLQRIEPTGGFAPLPGAPEADLLSTATALHALWVLGTDLGPIREPCLRFVRGLRRGDGAFAAHDNEETGDCEYTFYGLLALGHLAE